MDDMKHFFKVAGKTIIWIFDDNNFNKVPYNNLYILDDEEEVIWTLDDVARGDICVGFEVLNDKEIHFHTYFGADVFFDVEKLKVNKKEYWNW